MDRQQKEQVVAKIAEMLNDTQLLILVDYRGLKVPEMNQLRREFGKIEKCEFLVAKNKLVGRAFADTPFVGLLDHLVGPNALLFSYEDPVSPAKVLTEFAKKMPHLEIKIGMLAGKVIDTAQVRELAKMPTKEEQYGILAGVLAAPMRDMAGVLAAVPRSLLNVLNALKQEKEAA